MTIREATTHALAQLVVHRWVSTPIEHAGLPAVHVSYERMTERPGFVAHGLNHES